MFLLTYLIYIFITLCFCSTYISVSLHLSPLVPYLDGRYAPASVSSRAMEMETACLMYTTTSFSMTRRTWKNQKDRFTGIGVVEVSVFLTPAFIIMQPFLPLLLFEPISFPRSFEHCSLQLPFALSLRVLALWCSTKKLQEKRRKCLYISTWTSATTLFCTLSGIEQWKEKLLGLRNTFIFFSCLISRWFVSQFISSCCF